MLSNVHQTSDCCVCNGGENSVSNPVYRCKSCAIYVHQSCYGIEEKMDAGQADSLQTSHWLCRKCEAFGRANEYICSAICCKDKRSSSSWKLPAFIHTLKGSIFFSHRLQNEAEWDQSMKRQLLNSELFSISQVLDCHNSL